MDDNGQKWKDLPVHTPRRFRSTTRNWRRPRPSSDWRLGRHRMACDRTKTDISQVAVYLVAVLSLPLVLAIHFPIFGSPFAASFEAQNHRDSRDRADSWRRRHVCSHLRSRPNQNWLRNQNDDKYRQILSSQIQIFQFSLQIFRKIQVFIAEFKICCKNLKCLIFSSLICYNFIFSR